ncbi:hypothetical protein D1O33_18735 [Rhodococcus rhodochrous]|uniref:Mce-associated membrane protein n=1 Tax=Rhodococcus rhodochrous TaxID=1829 RepID=A0AAW4X8T9_RHORH|nr:hypothetical protein [Rhodococcus rhodochrous]MCD2109513.1 hypothetical protein [Rhodococcus rhodochrous]QHG83756.1 hypothetical protein D1O33_18735 [Rhodococcus rhodochrous]
MKKEEIVMSNTGASNTGPSNTGPSNIGVTEQEPAVSAPTATATESGSRGPWWSSVRTLAVVTVLAVVTAVTFGVLWATDDSSEQLQALQSRLDTEAEAEAVASDYALSVSEVDFRDLDAWRAALTDGVSEQLAPKLEGAVDVVAPWLTQMEYTAEARLLAAEVASNDGDTFVVQVFVDMISKSKQTPDGVAATATYTVTMDRASDWTITDVGGVGTGLPGGAGESEPAPAPADGGR